MAAFAQEDQKKRTVQVERKRLIKTLEENLANHIKDYEEAMLGYKNALLSKIDKAFSEAKEKLEKKHVKAKLQVSELTDADIVKQRDNIVLIEPVSVEMKVPRSYAKEYEAAIDMAKWDIREYLELTHAEFTCFVRDQWDWKSGFEAVSMLYKMSHDIEIGSEL